MFHYINDDGTRSDFTYVRPWNAERIFNEAIESIAYWRVSLGRWRVHDSVKSDYCTVNAIARCLRNLANEGRKAAAARRALTLED